MSPEPSEEDKPSAPSYEVATWAVIGAVVVGVLALFSVRCSLAPGTGRDYASRSLPPEPAPVLLPAPEIDDEYMPCSDCHEKGDPINREVRELEDEHDEMDFGHGDLWCLDCHDAGKQEMLRRSGGELVELEDSWRLCTQCHGKKLADWRAGVHGKRTGHWWGPKEYRTCVVCHDPHSPPFKPIEPMPVPKRPEEITLEASAAKEIPHGGE